MKHNFILILTVFTLFSLNNFSQEPDQLKQLKKGALVIGNGNYFSSTLANPENDARSISEVLKKLGFIVYEYENLSQEQMKRTNLDFNNLIFFVSRSLFFRIFIF